MKTLFTYTSIDKQIFNGNSAKEVVEDMKAKSFDGNKMTLDGFMRRTAATAYAWAKKPIRSAMPEEFLADLVEAGVLSVEVAKRAPDEEQVD